MSTCTSDCVHAGSLTKRPANCPDCGRFSSHSYQWHTNGPDGFFVMWGGTCSVHGKWSESN